MFVVLGCCRFNSNAIMEKLIEVMPSISEAIAGPLKRTEKMVFINSSGGFDGRVPQYTPDLSGHVTGSPVTAEIPSDVNTIPIARRLSQHSPSSAAVSSTRI